MREQIKLYHWQTAIFARHKATDEVIKALDSAIDLYVEIYMGKYGRPNITRTTNMIQIKNMSEKSAIKFIKDCLSYVQTGLIKGLKPTDSDLVNIRDEIAGELNQLLYLFTLK